MAATWQLWALLAAVFFAGAAPVPAWSLAASLLVAVLGAAWAVHVSVVRGPAVDEPAEARRGAEVERVRGPREDRIARQARQ